MLQLTSTSSIPQGYSVTLLQSLITTMKNNTGVGKSVSAAQFQQIVTDLHNVWRTHTHQLLDYTGIDTFGNMTAYTPAGTIVTHDTGAPTPTFTSATVPPGIGTDLEITAADINAIISLVNSMRTHSHTNGDQLGVYAPQVTISDGDYTAVTFDPTPYDGIDTPGYTVLEVSLNGQLLVNSIPVSQQWINMAPVDLTTGSQYQVRFTQIATNGDTVTGTFGTWLTPSQAVSVTSNTGEIKYLTVQVEIRDAASLVVLDTATITIRAITEITPTGV